MVELRDLPLFRWGEARHAARRSRLRRRTLIGGAALALYGATIVAPPAPLLVWNASASAPIGLYLVRAGTPARGDMVVAAVPPAVRRLAAARHYLPLNVPLVKRVAGVVSDRVCALGATVSINGRTVAIRRRADRRGRPLPWWSGCRVVTPGEVFLLIGEVPDSFDGRYFGLSQASQIVGKATALWVR